MQLISRKPSTYVIMIRTSVAFLSHHIMMDGVWLCDLKFKRLEFEVLSKYIWIFRSCYDIWFFHRSTVKLV
jgi:hypothetical protein